MEEEQTGTHTLAEWKAWYAEQRSDEVEFVTAAEPVPEEDTELERLWLVCDGKAPEDTRTHGGIVWLSKKAKTPIPGLSVLVAEKQQPLLLVVPGTELAPAAPRPKMPKKQTNSGQDAEQKPEPAQLEPPFEWRCRQCDQELFSDTTPTHCGRSMRQLAPVSEEGSKQFAQFIEQNEWTFMSPENSTLLKQPGVEKSEHALSMATEAGESLEKILRGVTKEVPPRFELYNEQTDRVRVSDLKTDDKFVRVFGNIGGWRESEMVPVTDLPYGNVEIGHVFDAFLSRSLDGLVNGDWRPGERVGFHAEDLGITIGGTPDLMFRDIPVETKTVTFLPHEGNKKQRQIFQFKWHANYLPQIAMYLEGTDHEWMLLMLVSRRSGLFTMLPITGVKMKTLRKRWRKLLKDDELAGQVANYREAIDSEE